MSHSSHRPPNSGAHSQDSASDGGQAHGPDPSEQHASDPGGSHALAPHRRRVLAARPEVIIEIPAPVKKGRRFVWLSAAIVPLIITVVALSALAIRSQRLTNVGQEATIEALVKLRLAQERASSPQQEISAALEATVEARVAIRLAEERAVLAEQAAATAPSAGEPAASAPTIAAPPVPDEPAPFYGEASVALNLRKGPGQAYDSQELIPAGTQLHLLGRTVDSGWFFVSKTGGSSADETGWVAAWLVTIPEDGDPLRLAVFSAVAPSRPSE